eukprot:6197383-Pleurochrysis_carterae.AAC.1
MGKHSKNNNDRAFFSYHERKAAAYGRHSSGLLGGHNNATGNFVDTGWGSHTRTLDSDAMKDIDGCSLSLQPCVEPVVTPQGVLYDKQVVFEYILDRKKDLERELKAWEAQQANLAESTLSEAQKAQEARIEEFVARQEGLSQSELDARHPQKGAVASTMGRSLLESDQGKHAADTSFWVPQHTPEAKQLLSKPDMTVRCPITSQPLRLKQLFPAKFTPADRADAKPDVAKKANDRYICPLTKKGLSNINPAAVLRPSGQVVSVQAVERIIKKDMLDPFTDPPTQLREKDIIKLRNEGTGFAARTDEKALKVTASTVVGRF